MSTIKIPTAPAAASPRLGAPPSAADVQPRARDHRRRRRALHPDLRRLTRGASCNPTTSQRRPHRPRPKGSLAAGRDNEHRSPPHPRPSSRLRRRVATQPPAGRLEAHWIRLQADDAPALREERMSLGVQFEHAEPGIVEDERYLDVPVAVATLQQSELRVSSILFALSGEALITRELAGGFAPSDRAVVRMRHNPDSPTARDHARAAAGHQRRGRRGNRADLSGAR
jgi:hypothetical protein